MPMYDYQCKNTECDNDTVVEVLHKMAEKPELLCSTCDTKLTKVIVAPNTPKVPHVSWSTWRMM